MCVSNTKNTTLAEDQGSDDVCDHYVEYVDLVDKSSMKLVAVSRMYRNWLD